MTLRLERAATFALRSGSFAMLRHVEDDGAGGANPPARTGPGAQAGARPAPRALVGWVLAALASALLAVWVGSGTDRALNRQAEPVAAPAAVPPPGPGPGAQPDPAQVRRAYEQVREIYAERGVAGLVAFSDGCAASLRSQPEALDFCLAFDHFAAALAGHPQEPDRRAWRADLVIRDLALARAMLPPGADPARRLAEIERLARQVGVQAEAAARPEKGAAAPPSRARPNPPQHARHAPARPVQRAAAPRPAAARQSASARCRLRSTPAERVVCASPGLRTAERRMQVAYRRALAAGADPGRLAGDQARWRVSLNAAAPDHAAVAGLYASRTRDLQAETGGGR